MSTETLNRTSVVTEVYPSKVSEKQDLSPNKVNIDVLRKRVFEEKKRERFQNRLLLECSVSQLQFWGISLFSKKHYKPLNILFLSLSIATLAWLASAFI